MCQQFALKLLEKNSTYGDLDKLNQNRAVSLKRYV